MVKWMYFHKQNITLTQLLLHFEVHTHALQPERHKHNTLL